MHFCYSDDHKSGLPSDIWNMPASTIYLNHFANQLFLDFMYANGTYLEQQQTRKELAMCDRKMSFWQRHPNFDADVVAKAKEKLLLDWRSGRGTVRKSA